MARPLDAETRLLYAENLTAFVMLFSKTMAAATFAKDEPSLNRMTGSDAWEGLNQVAEIIYEHLMAVHEAATVLSAAAPDVDAVME